MPTEPAQKKDLSMFIRSRLLVLEFEVGEQCGSPVYARDMGPAVVH